jgi:hypothetical protein
MHINFNRSAWVEGDFYDFWKTQRYVHRKLWAASMDVLVDLEANKTYVDAGPGLPGGHVETPEFREALPLFEQYLRLIGADEIKDIVLLGVYYDSCSKGWVLAGGEIQVDGKTKYYLMVADLCKHTIMEKATGELIVPPNTPLWG